MQIFEITTNEGTFLVSHTTQAAIRKRMYEYIREKRAKGKRLADIMYTWTTREVSYGKLP